MANSNYTEVIVFQEGKTIGRIALNGYNIAAGGPLGMTGAFRSFKVVSGEYWDQWNAQASLKIRDSHNGESSIRIFALPAEQGAAGLVEFIR